jgi:hypothetical protein
VSIATRMDGTFYTGSKPEARVIRIGWWASFRLSGIGSHNLETELNRCFHRPKESFGCMNKPWRDG